MQIFFSKKAKGMTGLFLFLFVLGFILINVTGYFFGLKYLSVLAAAVEINKYEVRSELLADATNEIGVCNPEKAVEVWANGIKKRSAAQQYSVMTKSLKDEYAKQLESSSPNWVTGMSSPWIDSFEIKKIVITDDDNYTFYINFYTLTSTGPAGEHKAEVSVAHEGDFWRITSISSDEKFDAYTGYQPPK